MQVQQHGPRHRADPAHRQQEVVPLGFTMGFDLLSEARCECPGWGIPPVAPGPRSLCPRHQSGLYAERAARHRGRDTGRD